jgi:hypothetical protein
MKKLTVIAAGLLLLVPTLAFSDTFSFRLGYFMPGASTNLMTHPDSLWAIEFNQMSFTKSKFQGSMLGFGYEYFIGPYVSLAFSLDSYTKNRPGYYVDYGQFDLGENEYFAFPYEYYDANIIEHAFAVSSTPLQLSVKLLPLGRKARLIPFVGGGAGLYFWSVRLQGEMIDFSDPWIYTDEVLGDVTVYPVNVVYGKERGQTFGFHAFGGLQVPIGFKATIDLEARYHWAKAKFDEWFVGFEDFDLGGLALSVGFSYWF